MYLYMWYACVHVTMYLYVFICIYLYISITYILCMYMCIVCVLCMCVNIAPYYDVICSWGGNVEKLMKENRDRRAKNNCTLKNKE